VIVGQTASGKSSLSLQLAQQFDGEIINADAWNVYKDMNIGTAKPSVEERRRIPHHLLDLVAPDADFTAVDFQRQANRAINEVHSNDKLPFMVGGNGLYVDSVLYDYSFLPTGDKGQRERLVKKPIEELVEIAKDKQIDLRGIDTRNSRRIIRAIETDGQQPTRKPLRENTLILGVHRSRTHLRKRIEQRVETMFAQGLPHEVRDLVDRYGWDTEAMKGIGYREFKDYFDNTISKNELKRRIVRSTLKLAKKQRSWFKRNTKIVWVESTDEAVSVVNKFLKNSE